MVILPRIGTGSVSDMKMGTVLPAGKRVEMPGERLVGKEGTCDLVRHWRLPRTTGSLTRKLLLNSGDTATQAQWRWCFLALIIAFPSSWLIFACFYFRAALRQESGQNTTLCLEHQQTFTAAFLFSLESQESIGYGFRYPNKLCLSTLLLPIQSLLGKLIIDFATSCILYRLIRPHERKKTFRFSKTAVITQIEGILYLIFRLGDTDPRQLVSLTYRLYYVDKKQSPETMVAMDVEENGDLFLLPTLVKHQIDQNSPLSSLRPSDLKENGKFELVVVVEGIVESSGLTAQAKTSYLPEEIQWGYQFDPLPLSSNTEQFIRVDYDHFNKTSDQRL